MDMNKFFYFFFFIRLSSSMKKEGKKGTEKRYNFPILSFRHILLFLSHFLYDIFFIFIYSHPTLTDTHTKTVVQEQKNKHRKFRTNFFHHHSRLCVFLSLSLADPDIEKKGKTISFCVWSVRKVTQWEFFFRTSKIINQ